MKKLLYILPLVMFAMTSCDWFELDNMDGHDAQVEGRFIDSKTGENVPNGMSAQLTASWNGFTATPVAGIFQVFEQGWDGEASQTWYYKNDGTYVNNLVWAGEYIMRTNDANFFPMEQAFTLKKGKNVVDFTVTPYARVVGEPTITYDKAGGKIKASVKVESGDLTKITDLTVQLQCFTDRFVCSAFNNVKNDPGTTTTVASGETAEVEIDMNLEANLTQFQYERTHYVRIGVLGKAAGVNNNSRYNYSATYALSTDGKVTKITEW